MLGLNGFADDPNWVLDAGRDYPRLAWQGTMGTTIPEPNVDWSEGQGTAQEPYRVATADQLILVGKASVLWDKHFVLDADIDLDPNLPERAVLTQPVVPFFSGVFDGGAHTISHLTIRGGNYLGLFGWVADPNSEIKNLNLVDPNVQGGDRLGALIGLIENGAVANCHVADANVLGTGEVGGLVGSHQKGTISDCSVLGGRISGNSAAGGLVGSSSRIIRCSVQQVEVAAGGVLVAPAGGLTSTAHEIVECRVTGGLVRGASDVGGLAARIEGGTISRCYASTRVETVEKGFSLWLTMGGLVGNSAAAIEDSYSTSAVTQINPNSFMGLSLSGAAGLVGVNRGTIRRSYSTGAVAASAKGGVFGVPLVVGGLVGTGRSQDVNDCFWDIETSGQATSAGGAGKTTAEMQTAATFLNAGWDFAGETANGAEDLWWIDEAKDYPRLWWEAANK
jgi:hypothetical protein